jgi:hypothetical protein
VSDFLSPDGTWNTELLQRWFLPIDVHEILKIRPSTRNEADFIAWNPEKSGVFTVRSAYRLGLEEMLQMDGRQTTSVRPRGDCADWKLIWQCPIPPKVRIFAWKLARNALATQLNMHKRGMETLDTCLICGTEPESTFHAMIKCPHARQLWGAMSEVWDMPGKELLFEHNPDWFLHALKLSNDNQRAPLLMTLWRIWHIHNEITHNKKPALAEAAK